MVGNSSLTTEKLTGAPFRPAYWGVKLTLRWPAESTWQRMVCTPVMLKVPVGGGVPAAGLTVRVKVVLAERLPGSVALTVTVVTPETEGVPEMVEGATKFSPAGKPETDKVNWLGVSASVNTPASESV